MDTLKRLTSDFYASLEDISGEHEELTDTEVREALHVALNYYFVWGKPMDRLPVNYAMFSKAGDLAVVSVVNRFLAEACAEAARSSLSVGQDRLNVIQDESIVTPSGESFDLYIGQTDEPLAPEPPFEGRFEPGQYDE